MCDCYLCFETIKEDLIKSKDMVIPESTGVRSISLENLLGRRLNDVELKFAPNTIYVRGSMQVPLPRPRVSIVGSRKASVDALSDARLIASALTEKKVVIVSGLAEGIDTSAHTTAMANNGKTIAVLGTPLNKSYPQKNFKLQQEIMRHHLVISQFEIGHRTWPKDFVTRNRTMALISDASIIVEASDKSGSRHQGWEALRLGRPLYIWHKILNQSELEWPEKMFKYGAIILSDPNDVLESLPARSQPQMLKLLT